MALSTYVAISISNATPRIERTGFGVPLLFGPAPFPERVKTYPTRTILTDLVFDGFTPESPVYKAAAAMRRQSRGVKTIKVGRRTALTQIFHLTPKNLTEGYVYSWSIGGESFTYTVGSSATVTIVANAIASEMSGNTGDWTAAVDVVSPNSTKVVVTADAPGTQFDTIIGGLAADQKGSGSNGGLYYTDATVDASAVADLALVREADDTWYALVNTNFSKDTCNDLADVLSGERKMLFQVTQDSEVKDVSVTTDIMSAAKADGHSHVAIMYSHLAHEMPHAAWAGTMLTYRPGEATYAHKYLAGVTATPTTFLAEPLRTVVSGKDGNYYVPDAAGITYPGLQSDDDYIDVSIGIDWTYARIEEEVMILFTSNAKIPFTDAGIQSVVAAVKQVLLEGAEQGLYLAESIQVSAPKLSELSAQQRASRVLPDVTFQAQFQGAIHQVDITGTVSA